MSGSDDNDDATQSAKRARVDIEAKLASGESMAKVSVPSSLTGDDLKAELEQHVGEDKKIQDIIYQSTLIGSRSLAEVGLVKGESPHVVNVVVRAKAMLYMFNPCSATEYAHSLVNLNDFDEVSAIPVFRDAIQFKPMDQAPSGAKEIADGLRGILQSSLGKMFPSPFGGFFDGHIVVLTGIRTETDAQVKLSFGEALGGINASAYEDIDDNSIEDEFLETASFQVEDWSSSEECPFANDTYALEDPGIDEEAMTSARAAQKLMVEKLKKHFLFEFDWDVFKLFPQIHGGFDLDGNVIGILRGRLVEG